MTNEWTKLPKKANPILRQIEKGIFLKKIPMVKWRLMNKHGLTCPNGIILGQRQDAFTVKSVNHINNSVTLTAVKTAPFIGTKDTHVLSIGPGRSGKTIGNVVTSCRQWDGNLICLDFKGEIYELTKTKRSEMSDVFLLAPGYSETAHYNPLSDIRVSARDIIDTSLPSRIESLVDIIFMDRNISGEFYLANAKLFLSAMILHVISCDLYSSERKTLPFCAILARKMKENGLERLASEMLGITHTDASGRALKCTSTYIKATAEQILGYDAKTRKGICETLESRMSWILEKENAEFLSKSDFTLSETCGSGKKISVYLYLNGWQNKESKTRLLKFVTETFLDFFLNLEPERHINTPFLFALDDFTLLGRLFNIGKVLQTGILAGVRMLFTLDSVGQFNDVYGKDFPFFANIRTICAYAPSDKETGKFLSKMAGGKMSVDDFMRLSETKVVVLRQGLEPYTAKKIAYFTDKRFK